MVQIRQLKARQVAVDVPVFPLALGRVGLSTCAVVGHLVGRSTVTGVRRGWFVLEARLDDRYGRTAVDNDVWTDVDGHVVLQIGRLGFATGHCDDKERQTGCDPDLYSRLTTLRTRQLNSKTETKTLGLRPKPILPFGSA